MAINTEGITGRRGKLSTSKKDIEIMRRPKIIADSHIPSLQGRLEAWSEPCYLEPADITADIVRDADALIVRTRTRCNRELLEGSNVRMIATATIGTDHIDTDYTREAGISVANAPGCNAPGVAQYVWASLLTLGMDPKELRMAVIGKGNIGSVVASWGRKLGAEIRVCDPPRAEAGFDDETYHPLEELLGWADVVTIHTPLTTTGNCPTRHMLNSDTLSRMRPGATLINAARGEVVDTEALIEESHRKGFNLIIDTWENEPRISRQLLQTALIATPHIAGYSAEGKQRGTRMALEATANFFGVTPDISGLAGPYIEPERIDPDRILASYFPLADTLALKQNPLNFESLRSNYSFRAEPRFDRI